MRADLAAIQLDRHLIGAGIGGPIEPPQVVARLVLAMVHELEALAGGAPELQPVEPVLRALGPGQHIPRSRQFALGQIFGDTFGHRSATSGRRRSGNGNVRLRFGGVFFDVRRRGLGGGNMRRCSICRRAVRSLGRPETGLVRLCQSSRRQRRGVIRREARVPVNANQHHRNDQSCRAIPEEDQRMPATTLRAVAVIGRQHKRTEAR
jgi:hypothetical protein